MNSFRQNSGQTSNGMLIQRFPVIAKNVMPSVPIMEDRKLALLTDYASKEVVDTHVARVHANSMIRHLIKQ